METPLLKDVVIILGLSVLIILLFNRFKIPPILGFLITGIVSGPHGLNLVNAGHEVELLSEIGIIFLLFVIGIEFSLKGLVSIKKTVLWGGLMQVGGTIGLTTLCAVWVEIPLTTAIFIGFLFSLSSTAIVLKMLQEKGEINSPHGKVTVGILIFQDIIVVLMMLVTPLLAGQSENPLYELLVLAIKLVGILVVLFLLGKYIVPLLFKSVVKAKSTELFILTIVVLCFATAWLTSVVGLSLALGAFFAGLIISESEYSHQATANILPFREIFISFFFVSIGMLLNLDFFFSHLISIHLIAIAVIILKMIVIGITVLILKYPPRTVFLTMLSIFQVGEFAFLLSSTGMEYQLLSDTIYQYFLAVSIITMGATPFILNYASKITDFLIKTPMPKNVRRRLKSITNGKAYNYKIEDENYHDHLVIIGYGLNGENVAKAAKKAKIPYLIVDLDVNAIARGKAKNEHVIFGDATNDVILKHVHIHEARVVVVAISSPETTKQIVKKIRTFTRTAHIIVRTRYVSEMESNILAGADHVIPEEFETSIQIFTQVLQKYLVPNHEIKQFVNYIRNRNYEMLSAISIADEPKESTSNLYTNQKEIATIYVNKGNNKIVGKTLDKSSLRSEYGVTLLAIKRGGKYITEISSNDTIQQEDTLYLLGNTTQISFVTKFLEEDY
ncbi:MAG: potassium transporter KefB [Bacteroidetes bacterium HGW-Bacteroidetes-12]|nr:MAG: potassium transporter KefB [Bacteroidetes bacterium HGW-Bacteroidetes-12]